MTKSFRIEHDSIGELQVPAEELWGAQTQRSLENFRIGGQHPPSEVLLPFPLIQKTAATPNAHAPREVHPPLPRGAPHPRRGGGRGQKPRGLAVALRQAAGRPDQEDARQGNSPQPRFNVHVSEICLVELHAILPAVRWTRRVSVFAEAEPFIARPAGSVKLVFQPQHQRAVGGGMAGPEQRHRDVAQRAAGTDPVQVLRYE